jgi:hypothetical protein
MAGLPEGPPFFKFSDRGEVSSIVVAVHYSTVQAVAA